MADIPGLSILSLDNVADIEYINHPRTPLDPRDYARFGLRAAFIPDLINVESFDRRMINLEAFAVKTEAEIFASTESQRKYLEVVSAKISEITKYIQKRAGKSKKVDEELNKLLIESRQIKTLPLLIPNLDDPEEKKFVQRQLVMMLHSQKCSHCSLPHCPKVKDVLGHTKTCNLKDCPETYCYSSKQIMCHWENCLQPDCSFCGPLRPKCTKQDKDL